MSETPQPKPTPARPPQPKGPQPPKGPQAPQQAKGPQPKSPQAQSAQPHVVHEKDHPGGHIFMYAMIALFALPLVAPGFIAGLCYRSSGNVAFPYPEATRETPMVIYFPALFLGSHIGPLNDFYKWEFKVAAGSKFTEPKPLTE